MADDYGLVKPCARTSFGGDDVTFEWSVSPTAGGTFSESNPDADADSVPNESSVLFTAGSYGNYTVTAMLDATECVKVCNATFSIRVR